MELPSDARLSDLQKPRWLSNQYPFVVFWPKWVSFNGPIFSRLNICDRTLSIQNIDMLHYALNSDIISLWQRLEHALVGLSLFLVKRAVGRKAELGFLPLPSDCGYASKHKEPRFGRYCAYKSRGAFIPLTTFCSFAIAMTHPSVEIEDGPGSKPLPPPDDSTSPLDVPQANSPPSSIFSIH
jgi:hypothetical protein